MALFLTQEQVEEMTGYKKKSCQIAYLIAERIPFRINGLGRPIVVVSDVPILRAAISNQSSVNEVMPDFKAMEALDG